MTRRLDYKEASPDGFKAQLNMEMYIHRSGLEDSLLELVKTRVSQINHCAWCLDMHTKDARARGETEQRLYLLPAWREAQCYTPRERAALAWAEEVTLVSQSEFSDELYAEMREQFSEKELVDLTFAIIAINGWNRLNVPFRTPVGDYQPAAR